MGVKNDWKVSLQNILSLKEPTAGLVLQAPCCLDDSLIESTIIQCYKKQGFTEVFSDEYGVKVRLNDKSYRLITFSNASHINGKIYITVVFL